MGYRWNEIARLIGEPTGTLRERLRVALGRIGKRVAPVIPSEGKDQ